MSNQTNDNLRELAYEHISYWSGVGVGAVLEADLERDDLDSLADHLKESARLMFDLEFKSREEVYGSEAQQEAADTLRDQLREDGVPF